MGQLKNIKRNCGTMLLLLLTSMQLSAKDTEKKGILLVSFGSSYPSAQASFQNIEAKVKQAFPDTEIRWAYTSKIIRHKLERQGTHIDSPSEALAKMADDGFKKVAVQSFHVIPGSEYHDLLRIVKAFEGLPKGIQKITLGAPLIFHHEDNVELAEVIDQLFRKKLGENDVLLFMGHGTEHSANICYPGFQYYLEQKSENYLLGTVEGVPTFDDMLKKLQHKKTNAVFLTPFMSVAGDHATNDMAGDEPDSWKSQLEESGFNVQLMMKGLAEYDAVVQIWIKHLKKAYDELEN